MASFEFGLVGACLKLKTAAGRSEEDKTNQQAEMSTDGSTCASRELYRIHPRIRTLPHASSVTPTRPGKDGCFLQPQ